MKLGERFFIVFGLLAGVVALLLSPISPFKFDDRGATTGQMSGDTALINLTQPEEIAFKELTIPYLRSRDYQSSLGGLREVDRNAQFTSYLTDYQSDGLKINGLLTVPNGEQPEGGWPAVVFVHGYIPPDEYRTQEKYQDYVNYLARNVLVVFKIDLRGHGSSEGQSGGAYYSADYVIDTLNARAALASSDFVNGDAIGLWGHSMSGNVVLRSLAAQPEIRAAVVWAGAGFSYQDLQEYGISDASYQRPPTTSPRQQFRDNLFNTHGRFNPESDFWQQVAPTNYLGDLRGAVQLHHAVNDNVVDIDYSRNLDSLLDSANVEHQLFEYQDGGHNLTGSAFNTAMQRTTDFYLQHLRD